MAIRPFFKGLRFVWFPVAYLLNPLEANRVCHHNTVGRIAQLHKARIVERAQQMPLPRSLAAGSPSPSASRAPPRSCNARWWPTHQPKERRYTQRPYTCRQTGCRLAREQSSIHRRIRSRNSRSRVVSARRILIRVPLLAVSDQERRANADIIHRNHLQRLGIDLPAPQLHLRRRLIDLNPRIELPVRVVSRPLDSPLRRYEILQDRSAGQITALLPSTDCESACNRCYGPSLSGISTSSSAKMYSFTDFTFPQPTAPGYGLAHRPSGGAPGQVEQRGRSIQIRSQRRIDLSLGNPRPGHDQRNMHHRS